MLVKQTSKQRTLTTPSAGEAAEQLHFPMLLTEMGTGTIALEKCQGRTCAKASNATHSNTPNGNEYIRSLRDLEKNGHSSIICDCPKLEATQLFINK